MTAPIYIISGVPGAGKTTVARALAARHPRALLITGDDLREMVVSGFASALDEWSPEHSVQFSLAWRSSASMAARYADAGFAVVIDDVVREQDLRRDLYPELGGRKPHRVLLQPSLANALARNRARTNKGFDTDRLIPIIERLNRELAADTAGWTVIDTTDLSVAETVERILHSFGGPESPAVRKY